MAPPRLGPPMRLARVPEAFNDRDWLFEIKHDGYRCVAYVGDGACELVSRNGDTFKRWPELCREVLLR